MKRDNNNSMSSSPFFTSKNSSNNNEKPNTKFSFNNNNKKIFVNNADIDHDKDFGSDRFVVNDGFVKMQVHRKNTNENQIFAFEYFNKIERYYQLFSYIKIQSRNEFVIYILTKILKLKTLLNLLYFCIEMYFFTEGTDQLTKKRNLKKNGYTIL